MQNLIWCKSCINNSLRPRITFDKNGFCNACQWKDEKRKINWEKRQKELKKIIKKLLQKIIKYPIGEIILNSIDRDGTGNGLDFKILDLVPKNNKKSVILSAGCGNQFHFEEGIKNNLLDAISTANLLNFVGNTLKNARNFLLKKNYNLPSWNFENKIFKN